MSRMRKKTNDPMGNRVLRALGVDAEFGLGKPDTRLWRSDEHGPVKVKINPTRFRNRACYCNSGLKFKDCCLNKGGANALQSEGKASAGEEGGNVAREANVQVGGEREEGHQTTSLENRRVNHA